MKRILTLFITTFIAAALTAAALRQTPPQSLEQERQGRSNRQEERQQRRSVEQRRQTRPEQQERSEQQGIPEQSAQGGQDRQPELERWLQNLKELQESQREATESQQQQPAPQPAPSQQESSGPASVPSQQPTPPQSESPAPVPVSAQQEESASASMPHRPQRSAPEPPLAPASAPIQARLPGTSSPAPASGTMSAPTPEPTLESTPTTAPIPTPEQQRLAAIEAKLSALAQVDSVYLTEIDISMGRQPLSELLRNVAKVAEVNLSVRGADGIQATCTFSRAKITDLVYFLCKEYGLDIDVVGNIVAISPLVPPPPVPREIGVSHRADSLSGTLSFDLSGDRLADVTKKITDMTGTNFFVPHALSEQRLSGYIVDMPFGGAIQSIAAMNGLEAVQDADNVWAFYLVDETGQASSAASSAPAYRRRMPFSPTELSIDSLGLITAQIGRGSVQDIITDLCEQQRLNYFFASPVQGQTSIYVRETDFRTLLDVMLLGTSFSYYYEDGVYIFSAAGGKEQMPVVEKVDMHYRSVNKLSEVIPDALKSGVQVKEFADLNSIILCGDRQKVSRIESFLRTIDRRVPMVTIEIMIVDATKSRVMDIGTEFGFGKSGVTSAGSLGGGVDLTLNALSVNNLINSFNGFGSVNLGKVSSGFYFGLQFLEENGVIDMRSTPKLSTLNGHEATLKSGETRYYKEVSNNYYGSQIPVSTESYMWKPVDANLDIKITPFVSEDKHITLDIKIDQTEFTVQTDTEAPPGTATRSFSSLIRVQNEEMVLLGGIDQNVKEKANKGLPWIARVPVLRWLFGKSKDRKQEHLLNVFIKPTLIE